MRDVKPSSLSGFCSRSSAGEAAFALTNLSSALAKASTVVTGTSPPAAEDFPSVFGASSNSAGGGVRSFGFATSFAIFSGAGAFPSPFLFYHPLCS